MAELLLTLRDREISRTPVTHTRVVIGREATCDVVIDNAGVSRNHAVIVFDEGEFRVRDTESQNGITVNGKRVAEATLQYGDVIGIGKFELKLCETGDDEMELEAGTAAKSNAPRSVMATMQMDGAAAARMRDEILAKQKAKNAKRSAAPRAAAGANPNAGPGAQKARSKPAAREPRPEAAPRKAPSAQAASHASVALSSNASLLRKPAAIAAMVIVPIALIALWLMRG